MFALQGVPQLEGLSVCRRVGGWSGVAGWSGTGSSAGGRCVACAAVSRGLWLGRGVPAPSLIGLTVPSGLTADDTAKRPQQD